MFLGIDTSNYSTSAALVDKNTYYSVTKLLPVKSGEAGLRQADAVFHHTKALPAIISELYEKAGQNRIDAIGVTMRPRPVDGSYMPCFLCGEGLADSLGTVLGVKVYKLSHQEGHILAALYSAGRLDLPGSPFIAFHVSGGTTEAVICRPSETNNGLPSITYAAGSLDLKAGQLIDRTGLLLGLDFPCGIAIEALADGCDEEIKVKPFSRGLDVSLSGFENKAQQLLEKGASREYIAKFVLTAVYSAIYEMTVKLRGEYGGLPVIYAGGVMSDIFIQDRLKSSLDSVYFSAPELSRDNAVGAALYAYLSENKGNGTE